MRERMEEARGRGKAAAKELIDHIVKTNGNANDAIALVGLMAAYVCAVCVKPGMDEEIVDDLSSFIAEEVERFRAEGVAA